MKKILSLLLLALSLNAHASQAPFGAEEEARFKAVESGSSLAAASISESKLSVPNTSGLFVPRVARIVWDSTSGTNGAVGSHALGVTIPANAVIRQAWFFTKTSLVSVSNNGTIAFQCNSANDIFAAADIDASSGVAGQIGAGVETGTAATMLKVTTACNVAAVVAVNAFTAGKIDLFVEYVIAE
jgi:hypothetical protein